jgi:Uma2 family endonuclease
MASSCSADEYAIGLPLQYESVAMNVVRGHSDWTVASFLEWEARQETRFEFDGVEPVGMVGAPISHHRIIRNGEAALRRRLSGCEVFRETVKLRTAHTVRYPDLMVVCSTVAGTATEVVDPVVVIEVLSDATAGVDRIAKNEEYRLVPSIMHYVMLEQDRVAATVFSRTADDWIGKLVTGEGDITFPEIGVSMPLSEFYEGVGSVEI